MSPWLAVAIGGALGAVLRHGANRWVLPGAAFPWATLSVNLAGSLLAGVAFVALAGRSGPEDPLRAFLSVGLLGALTTYSTFSLETVRLAMSGQQGAALLNLLVSVGGCVAGCWLGVVAARNLMA